MKKKNLPFTVNYCNRISCRIDMELKYLNSFFYANYSLRLEISKSVLTKHYE